MRKKLFVYLQHILPQRLLTSLVGKLAESRTPWIKNGFISWIMRTYDIDMSSAAIEDCKSYATFNDFFTRKLKPGARPFTKNPKHILSPVDGCIVQTGKIHKNQLLQAKEMYFSLETLLGNDKESAAKFYDGQYAIFYLAPHNYHRVHMPVTGKLVKSIFIPGKLFSVNKVTSDLIPNLYARNERLVNLFDTDQGPTAVILVGAMIVASIQPAWREPYCSLTVVSEVHPGDKELEQGDEVGLFKMGSTVVLLFSKDEKITWLDAAKSDSLVEMGQVLGIVE